MKPNTAPDGTRYGVIACASLNQDLVSYLFYGSQATNVSEEEAEAEVRAEAEAEYEALVEEADISAAESGADRRPDFSRERFQENWFDLKGHEHDKEIFVEIVLDRIHNQRHSIEEPTISGVYEGVTYEIGWLGGAPMLWVLQGPTGNVRALCSPCVPNAADLDSGFVLDSEPEFTPGEGFPCYCVPRDWLDGALA